MIQTFSSRQTRRETRIWLDELPNAAIVASPIWKREKPFGGAELIGIRQYAAIETFKPIGGMFHYGLLGAEFISDRTGMLSVVLPEGASASDQRFVGSLAGQLDTVVIGTTPEYAVAIIESLGRRDPRNLPSGNLTFSALAHGYVGSAPIVFSVLAWAVIHLLTNKDAPSSAEEVGALLSSSE